MNFIGFILYNQCLNFAPAQVLATGLSGLYSSLPTKLEVPSEEWHCLHREDWLRMPALVQFLNSLEFCNAVIQVQKINKQTLSVSDTLCLIAWLTTDIDLPVCRWRILTSETSSSATSTMGSSYLCLLRLSIRFLFYCLLPWTSSCDQWLNETDRSSGRSWSFWFLLFSKPGIVLNNLSRVLFYD